MKQRVSIGRILAKALLEGKTVHIEGMGMLAPQNRAADVIEAGGRRVWTPPVNGIAFTSDTQTWDMQMNQGPREDD
ncbi:MAG: hypothetical protein EBR20_02285 [Bacteroidetes bacterium]|nr:hypothetical protein [Bacteroidota bacterium]